MDEGASLTYGNANWSSLLLTWSCSSVSDPNHGTPWLHADLDHSAEKWFIPRKFVFFLGMRLLLQFLLGVPVRRALGGMLREQKKVEDIITNP